MEENINKQKEEQLNNEQVKNDSNFRNSDNLNSKNNFKKSLVIFVIVFVLTMAVTLQIKTVQNSGKVGTTPQENKLRDLLLKDKENYAKLEELEAKREETLDRLREDAAKNDKRAKDTMEKLSDINKKLGLLEVTGPGVVVTVSDGTVKKDSKTMDYTQLIVHDMDILHIVNILRNAGAENISVNGQRIVAPTGISCIGVVIKINEEKIGSPYVISAIGNQDNLESAINMAGGIRDMLKGYGINMDVVREDNITLPKYTGVYKSTFNSGE